MKRNLLAVAAIVGAFVFSSFTSDLFFADVYMVYNGGTEKAFASYSQQSTSPGVKPNVAPITLAWAKFIDGDGIVSPLEFPAEFEAVDGNFGGSDNDLLSDESEDGLTIEKQ